MFWRKNFTHYLEGFTLFLAMSTLHPYKNSFISHQTKKSGIKFLQMLLQEIHFTSKTLQHSSGTRPMPSWQYRSEKPPNLHVMEIE